jgi:hypothetical protein
LDEKKVLFPKSSRIHSQPFIQNLPDGVHDAIMFIPAACKAAPMIHE